MPTTSLRVITLVLAGCGNVSPHNQGADATPDAAAIDTTGPVDAGDADAAPRRCSPTAPFQSPVKLAAIDTADSDENAWLSPDELTLYFSSTRTGTLGGYDIFMATRANRDANFGHVTPVA